MLLVIMVISGHLRIFLQIIFDRRVEFSVSKLFILLKMFSSPISMAQMSAKPVPGIFFLQVPVVVVIYHLRRDILHRFSSVLIAPKRLTVSLYKFLGGLNVDSTIFL